jgi:hypothetical protein
MRNWLMAMAMLLVWVAPAEAKRVALVIANGRYVHATALKNPPADARLIAASLKQAGFDDVAVKTDLSKTQLEAALRDFGARAEGAEVALIYYAGHGIEAGGQNYLIPVDAQLIRDRDLEIEATRLDTALLMAEAARMRIVVLDACRNNPFTASMQRTFKTRSVGRGLAAVEPEGETLVVYAAKAGATAADGEGENSPFAQALARRLPEPGLEISLLFRAVRDDVLQRTGRTQEPFTYGSLSGQAFYFRPPVQTTTVVTSTAAPAPAPAASISAETTEILYWQGTVTANSETAYRSYLTRYPQGQFAGLAEENVKRLTQPAPAPAVAAKPRRNGLAGGMFGGSAKPQTATGSSDPALATGQSLVDPGEANRPRPSFSCGGKLTRVERMICNAPALSLADRNFGQRFTDKLRPMAGDGRVTFIRWAAENRRERDVCPTHGCILDWYARMTNGLSAF